LVLTFRSITGSSIEDAADARNGDAVNAVDAGEDSEAAGG
jgi:hypothetical protein